MKRINRKLILCHFLTMYAYTNCIDIGGIKWLALKEEDMVGHSQEDSKDIVSDEGGVCGMADELGVHPCAALVHVARAATLTKNVCKQVHSHRRWNCSSVDLAPNFTPELLLGTKEQSFVYALSSASLTYTMARACSSGALFSCTCQPSWDRPNGDFKWGGCSDNLRWAGRFVRRFIAATQKAEKQLEQIEKEEKIAKTVLTSTSIVDSENATQAYDSGSEYTTVTFQDLKVHGVTTLVKRDVKEPKKKYRGRKKGRRKVLDKLALEKKLKRLQPFIEAANMQNTKAGRKLMERSTFIQCKCHGVSGSCSVRTCWRSLKPLIQVADRLWGAVSRSVRATSPKPRPWSFKKPNELLFVSQSPDYCSYDPSVGSLGTKDRICNGTSRSSEGGCRYMCCGRGYKTAINETIERCNCRYIWCCKVECQVCKTTIETHHCN